MNAGPRILALEGWPTLFAGGQERSLFEVVCGLRRLGVEVTLAYEKEGELVPRYQAQGVKTFRISTRNLQLKSWHAPRNLVRFTHTVVLICARHWFEKKSTIDLIYVNQYFDTPLAAICGLLLGVPVVCHLRLPAPEYLSRQYRWGLSRCVRLIANSHFTAETYVEAGLPRESIAVVHNAIDMNEFIPASTAESEALEHSEFRQILYVGRITPEKGIDTLIEAMAIARRQDPRLRLLIVGNVHGAHTATYDYQAELRQKARVLCGDAVEFRPATPNVADLYKTADLVVVPSRWEEPFGRVLIEAMACGVPCIGTRVGGIPEILSGDLKPFLVTKDDPQELGTLLVSYSDWRVATPYLGEQVRKHVVHSFNQVSMHQLIFDVLDSIVFERW